MSYEPQKKFVKEKTKRIVMNLHIKNDSDIIQRLDDVGNKQGYIKDLIRSDIEKSQEKQR